MKIATTKRQAISPIIATVLVIAATLIAFAAVAGYMFGIFGSTATKANVSVSTETTIPHSATGITAANVYFLNSGTSSATVASGTLAYGGSSCALTLPASNPSLTPGSATEVAFTLSSCSTTASAGQTYTISLSLSDGSPVQYQGIFT